MESTKQPRDEKGRFLSYADLTKKINRLQSEIESLERTAGEAAHAAKFWEQEYSEMRRKFNQEQELSNRRKIAIKWLLKKVFCWTRREYWKKFGTL